MMRVAAVLSLSTMAAGQPMPQFNYLANNLGDDLTALFPGVTLTPAPATTIHGPIVGRAGAPDSITRFYGVPTSNSTPAAMPRFKMPIALTPWTTPMETTMIKHCYQGDDCHYINIATPDGMVSDPPMPTLLPVFVYFSGGGYIREDNKAGPIMGMAFHPRSGFTGPDDSTGKAVLIFAHFRIGPTGFLAHPGLPVAGNGNWGISDGIAALEWVRDNGKYIGGDNMHVSIRGASAGGAYTLMILASPLSVGLVNNIFAMSPYTSMEPAFFSNTIAQEMNMLYANLFCGSSFAVPAVGSAEAASQAACLQTSDIFAGRTDENSMDNAAYLVYNTTTTGLDPAATIAAFETYYNTPGLWNDIVGYTPWTAYPNIDGVVFDMDPLASYRTGRNKAVTAVMGHTPNEYSVLFTNPGEIATTSLANHQFILGLSTLPPTATLTEAIAAIKAAPTITDVTTAVYSNFANEDFTSWTQNIQSAVDVWFNRAIDLSAKSLMAGGSMKVYKMLYMFGVPATPLSYIGAMGGLFGAFHAGEDSADMGHYAFGTDFIGESFGLYANGPLPWSEAELQFGQAVVYYWKNIMMTGNPNGNDPQYPNWPANSMGTMALSPSYADGAGMGGCIRHYPCLSEPAMNFRRTQLDYFEDPYHATPGTMPGCADGTAPYVDKGASGVVTGGFGLTMPDFPYPFMNASLPSLYSCSTCSCTGRRDRNALFGAPSGRSTCSCA